MKQSTSCSQVTGVITALRTRTIDLPTLITVQYTVGDTTFEITESLKLKSEAIKLWIFPIGQRKVPVLKNTEVGSKVTVCYDPADPQKAYLPENVGKMNV